jgi:hypothetical protein
VKKNNDRAILGTCGDSVQSDRAVFKVDRFQQGQPRGEFYQLKEGLEHATSGRAKPKVARILNNL